MGKGGDGLWVKEEMVYGGKRRNPIYICETCTLDADTKEASVSFSCSCAAFSYNFNIQK
jgi:hypothetical protein